LIGVLIGFFYSATALPILIVYSTSSPVAFFFCFTKPTMAVRVDKTWYLMEQSMFV